MPTPKKQPMKQEDDGLVVHAHNETPQEVEAYWTAQRVKGAKPVPMPIVVLPIATEETPASPMPKKGKK
jgi:hypothetical protein